VAHVPSAAAIGAVPRLTAAQSLVLRVAFAATFGFAIALALHWEFSFLAPMLAIQILSAAPRAPGLRQGLAIPLVIYIATTAALAISTLLFDARVVLVAMVGLVICWSFYGQRRGAPGVIILLLQVSFCAVPLMSAVSLDLAHSFADFLQRGSVAAIGTVWIAHALFPAPPPAQPAAAPPKALGLPPAFAARVAITDTAILLPLLVNFMIGGDVNNLVILVTTLNLLRELQPGPSGRVAVGLLIGNVLGGALAVVAQQFVIVGDTLLLFLLTIFLAGLGFAGRLVRGGPSAPIFALAFAAFLLLMGLAITPLPGGSEESFVLRVLKIGLASAYALGALSLAAPLRRPPGPEALTPGSGSA
jgi:hypothetical protein